MSWLSSFLHPGKGYQKGQEQLDKYYQQAQNYYNQGQGYLQPYNEFGQKAYGDINTAMQKLLNPGALQDEWIKGYSESDAAKNLEDTATQRGLNAASSLGLMGSSPALSAIQQGTSQIAAQDRQQYLDDLMQKYLSGIGIGQGIFGTGANAASGMSNNALNMGKNSMEMGKDSAQLAFGKENAGGNMFSKLLEGGISAMTPVGQAWGMNKLGLNQPWSFTGGR